MTDDKKLVEDWLCEHFPYHLQVNKDIPKDAYVMIKSEMLMSQGWLWVDNPPYQSFEDVMFGYTVPRDFLFWRRSSVLWIIQLEHCIQ